ncbi:tripartite tricarboxylate transporter substrate binding protein [Variovorax sp. WS11]|uniref:Bug family tripartite tricarboxylate transporter substrate binding protein n=1 Tax=Variovorax sp. WS11 TaxID=1105204 RepID=UPI000D0D5248|nr:tripartite tricarboxylate transporter substrate binding protein [Variovorax sp. WS11]NDZ18531.1 tripartite tricarboxylate transporter substrate binding protein [Variovorax sp. WS11]PSL85164.1 tripartite tricarboxylate transporter substrate binding protein [Variovorax sp. WS11]
MKTSTLTRRSVMAAAAALALGAPAWAQQPYPSKPIRIIVPYAAGGSTDQLARAIQQPMSEALGQPVIVENKAGAGGTIGTDYVAKSAPDGYTLVFGNTGPNAVVQLMRKVPYDGLKDLRPISTVAFTPMILAVPTDSPANNLKEFLAYAKKQGSALNFGSVGNGSLSHLTGEYFNELAGIRMQHVPYNGGAPMMTAFVGGQIQSSFVTGLDGATLLASGKVRYLAVGTPKRTDAVPGLPAIAEDVPGFRSVAWFGVLAPKGIPDDVAARLHAAVVAAVERPEVRKMFADRKIEAKSSTPAELEKIIQDEIAQWGPVVRKYKIEM